MVPGAAPRQLAALVLLVRGDQLAEPLEIGRRGGEPLQHEPDARLAHPEAALGIVVREVRPCLDRLLQVGDVVPSQLDEATPGEAVERIDDARAAEIHRSEARRRVGGLEHVQRMRRPAVVEPALRVGDDRGERRPRPPGARRLVSERLVRFGRVEHRASLGRRDRTGAWPRTSRDT
jgi:hypothetical protein